MVTEGAIAEVFAACGRSAVDLPLVLPLPRHLLRGARRMPMSSLDAEAPARGRLSALAIAGAVGGIYGAATMSVLRFGARRAGVIDKMTPQVVEEWLADRLGASPPGGAAGHHVADQLLHLSCGAFCGALGGPLLGGQGPRAGLWRGAVFGLAVWAVGTIALMPSLRISRSALDATLGENVTNVAAHVLYGLAVQLMVEEPRRQPDHRRSSDPERAATRVG
jgi:hypothetical protein